MRQRHGVKWPVLAVPRCLYERPRCQLLFQRLAKQHPTRGLCWVEDHMCRSNHRRLPAHRSLQRYSSHQRYRPAREGNACDRTELAWPVDYGSERREQAWSAHPGLAVAAVLSNLQEEGAAAERQPKLAPHSTALQELRLLPELRSPRVLYRHNRTCRSSRQRRSIHRSWRECIGS